MLLQHRDLSSNKIEELGAFAFSHVTDLMHLYVSDASNAKQSTCTHCLLSCLPQRLVREPADRAAKGCFRWSPQPGLGVSSATLLAEVKAQWADCSSFLCALLWSCRNVDNNQISRIDANAFEGSSQLEKLWMTGNQLGKVPLHALHFLENLREL